MVGQLQSLPVGGLSGSVDEGCTGMAGGYDSSESLRFSVVKTGPTRELRKKMNRWLLDFS